MHERELLYNFTFELNLGQLLQHVLVITSSCMYLLITNLLLKFLQLKIQGLVYSNVLQIYCSLMRTAAGFFQEKSFHCCNVSYGETSIIADL